MYKVFYKDRTVFFVENDHNCKENGDTKIHYFKNKKQLKTALNIFLNNYELASLYIVYRDIDHAFKKYTKLYKLIEAAGGLVKADNDKILVIHRRGKWDLPKGKLEKNELPEIGAIREVEEECGIKNLEIINLLEITYHTYILNGKDILKRTFWYEMTHKGNQEPKPQTEEEITEAKWIKTDNLDEVINNTFSSIIEVLKKGKVI
ncbi:MAG: NUDIX domain-containing protein [Bacteroidales bacterium]|nr:NUDIX domain-containing protein [Bacteroidales bacterium]